MTKLNTTLSTVITYENASENGFADNYAKIYKPFFAELKKRIAYFEQQKGQDSTKSKLAYDIKNGIRNEQGNYCFNPDKKKTSASQKQFLSFASKFAAMPEKELLKLASDLGGNTIGTLYKNMSNAKTASTKSSPKLGKKPAKPASQPEKSGENKNDVLSAFNRAINGFGENMTSAQFAAILIGLADIAGNQYDNCDAAKIKALLENPAMAQKLAKSA